MTHILVTADDFGFSGDTVKETIRLAERGVVKNLSLMACGAALEDAIDFALARPDLTYGVHLTFVGEGEEHRLSRDNGRSLLADRAGRFFGPRKARTLAMLRAVPPAQIAREIEAQLSAILATGIEISYVDSHMHMHKFPLYRETLAKILPKYGIAKVRTVQDVYCAPALFSPTFWLGRIWKHKISANFVTTCHFFMPHSEADRSWPEKLLEKSIHGALEVGCHPGSSDPWRRAETIAVERFVARAAEREDVRLISWRNLPRSTRPSERRTA